jgi:predicted nuclease of predicted toxin-antitoxin system
VRLLVDAALSPDLPALLRRLRNVQASHVADHGLQRAPDDIILRYAAPRRMLLITNDAGISPPRFPIGTHAGVIIADLDWLESHAIVARLRLLWRSGLRSRLPRSVTTIDDQGVKILGPDPTQRLPDVFVVPPHWTARGARLEPAAMRP